MFTVRPCGFNDVTESCLEFSLAPRRLHVNKGVKYRFGYSDSFRGRPRGRIVDSSPNRLTVAVVHCWLPKGTPRLILLVNASCSLLVMV